MPGRAACRTPLPFVPLPPHAGLQHERPLIRTELQQPGKSRPDAHGCNLAGFMHDQIQIVMLVSECAEPRSQGYLAERWVGVPLDVGAGMLR